MPALPYQVLIFDKDGTLLDLAAFWFAPLSTYVRELCLECGPESRADLEARLLRAAGFSPDGRLIPESLVVAGTNLDIAQAWQALLLPALAPGRILGKDFVSTCRKRLGALAGLGVARPTEDGLPDLCTELKKQGYRLALATSDDYEQSMLCLASLGLAEHFDLIMSADRVAHPKPHPDSLNAICETFSVSPRDCLMIGDSLNDMRFAQNSACDGFFYEPDGLQSAPLPPGACARLTRLSELPERLRTWPGSETKRIDSFAKN